MHPEIIVSRHFDSNLFRVHSMVIPPRMGGVGTRGAHREDEPAEQTNDADIRTRPGHHEHHSLLIKTRAAAHTTAATTGMIVGT